MAKKLQVIFVTPLDDGDGEVVLAVDQKERLYINGDPIVTKNRVTLDWWMVMITGVIAAATAISAAVNFYGVFVGKAMS